MRADMFEAEFLRTGTQKIKKEKSLRLKATLKRTV